MNELEDALIEYIENSSERGGWITAKDLRDTVAVRFISEEITLSEAVSLVNKVIRHMYLTGGLRRVRRGLYQYLPGYESSIEVAPEFEQHFERTPTGELSALSNFSPFPIQLAELESVSSLSRSGRFLIQRNLHSVDLDLLQGMSF